MRCMVAAICATLMAAASGCSEQAPPPEGRVAIETVAEWYQKYRAAHKKPPPDEEALVAYIGERLKGRGVTLDPELLLTSPRDGKKFVVMYGKLTSRNPEHNVAVYEQEGYNGQKLMAFESARSEEVTGAQLEAYLEGE